MLSLLAYPIVFGLLEASGFKLEQKKINVLFTTFVLSTVTFFMVSFIYFWRQEFTFYQTIIHYFNLIDIRLEKFSIHAIYYAIYIGVSILMTVELIKNNTSRFYKIIYFLLAVFLSIVIVILMRKGPIIYLMVALFFLLKIHFNIKKTIILISTAIVFLFLFTTIAPKYQNINRFNELISRDLNSNSESSLSIRYRIYGCVFEKIAENPLLGYGLGNVKSQLDSCYVSKNIDLSVKNYNSHNQFLSVCLTTGVLGLLLYLFSLYKVYGVLNTRKSKIGFVFFIFFILNFFTENILERESGVLLYSFLISFFLFQKEESSKVL
jgi:O-antigen ligase